MESSNLYMQHELQFGGFYAASSSSSLPTSQPTLGLSMLGYCNQSLVLDVGDDYSDLDSNPTSRVKSHMIHGDVGFCNDSGFGNPAASNYTNSKCLVGNHMNLPETADATTGDDTGRIITSFQLLNNNHCLFTNVASSSKYHQSANVVTDFNPYGSQSSDPSFIYHHKHTILGNSSLRDDDQHYPIVFGSSAGSKKVDENFMAMMMMGNNSGSEVEAENVYNGCRSGRKVVTVGHDGRSMQMLEPSSHESSSSSCSNNASANKINGWGQKRVAVSSGRLPSLELPKKKPRLTPQSSCPALKVRKEKIGDRIAALHRLVAPFGKTDTASVLTEAIGYIQFLQDQIQTLSMPYIKSTRSKIMTRKIKVDSTIRTEKGRDEREQLDLRSRGLCLVPSSFSSFLQSPFDGGIS